jgi:hypothetical protein
MRMLMASAALSAGILAFAAGGMTEAADFNEASVQGPYSLFLNGTITFAKGKPLFLPTWSVGVIRADGAGHIVAAEAMVNVGGCVILKQAGTGTYSVNPNGTGRAEAELTSELVGAPNAQCPSLDQGLLVENVQFAFDFAINADELDVVGTSWEGPNGPIVAFGSSGQAKPQVRSSSTRATPK